MKHWYFPSWNGDFRLRPMPKHPDETELLVTDPTHREATLLNQLGKLMREKEWVGTWKAVKPGGWLSKKVRIEAPLEQVGPLFTSVFKPGPAVLTALRYDSGKMMTCSLGPAELTKLAEELQEEAKAEPDKPQPTSAVTVRRPTPSCPSCIPGSVAMASEVLLAFLTEKEHETWARERAIYVRGGLSGHTYRISHRHARAAQEDTRICRDIDDEVVLHFHDWAVPPEEEVLAAKLCLEHREPWLRNEATLFHEPRVEVYKNPFGDMSDGVMDASLTRAIGQLASGGRLL